MRDKAGEIRNRTIIFIKFFFPSCLSYPGSNDGCKCYTGRRMGEQRVREVVKKLELSREQLLAVAARFAQGEGLANLPSFIFVEREPVMGEYLALELGGTFLRAVQIHLRFARLPASQRGEPARQEKGELQIDYLTKIVKGEIPCGKIECSVSEFYTGIVQKLWPVLEEVAARDKTRYSTASGKALSMGFTFSFPVKTVRQADGDVDGKLLYWTKGVRVPGLVEKFVGQGLKAALRREGYQVERMVVLNDTVATFLAGLVSTPGDPLSMTPGVLCAGLVVGTGTNMAVMNDESMVVNTEMGNLDISGLGIETDWDRQVDLASAESGKNRFEKLVAGLYLPRIFNEIVGEERVRELREFRGVRGKEEQIAQALVKRSAQLVGAVVVGAVNSTTPGDSLHPPAASEAQPLRAGKAPGVLYVVGEGSVFWQVSRYREMVQETVRELEPRVKVEFVEVENPGLIGAALAAALVG